jgi:hypothetical protein
MNIRKFVQLFLIFFSLIGLISSILVFLILFFGETSKDRREAIFSVIKSFAGIGKKYDGFIANTPEKIFKRQYYFIKNQFIKFPYDSLNIEIDLENLKILEKLRDERFNQVLNKNNKAFSNSQQFVNARVNLFNKNKDLNKKLKVKIRPKGDRKIHFNNLDSMSYKLDVRGKNKFIYGMEEMSIQKPITRNYAWEILYHQILKSENLIGLNIIPIKLFRNNQDLGIFFIEEGFGKELLEKQLRKNGPIIGIDENFSHNFPNIKYEYYSQDYWLTNNREIYFKSKENLDKLRLNYKNKDFQLKKFFDIDKWAKFFAISDLLGMFHGTVPKSVKLYYNPTTGLFEPIGFDGHYLSGYDKFSFIDYIYDPLIECGYACDHKNWLSLFFNKGNKYFITEYLNYLKMYSSAKNKKLIKKIYENKIKNVNDFLYTEYSNADRIFYKGILPYYFDLNVLINRIDFVKNKIIPIEKYLENFYTDAEEKISNINYQKKIDFSKNKILIPKGKWFFKNITLSDKEIILEDGAIIILEGKNLFIGKNKQFIFSGSGMIVQNSGEFNLDNVIFSDLKNINVRGYNWSGAINIYDSYVILKNVHIKNNLGEDSINIVNSNTKINNLKITNSENDSVDIDFGKLTFNKIECENSGNDCLDTSGATVKGNKLLGVKIKDKLGSFGEKSKVLIDEVNSVNANIGVVSKDSSDVKINSLFVNKTKIFAASYNKKFFFDQSKLKINNLVSKQANTKPENLLVSKKNKLTINGKIINDYKKNKIILNKIY